MKPIRKPIMCKDGFKMSVQASWSHYCVPRKDSGPYTNVEVGFPSEQVEELVSYIDGPADADPTGQVYGYVPVQTVVSIIAKHGGQVDDGVPFLVWAF